MRRMSGGAEGEHCSEESGPEVWSTDMWMRRSRCSPLCHFYTALLHFFMSSPILEVRGVCWLRTLPGKSALETGRMKCCKCGVEQMKSQTILYFFYF